MSRRRKAEPSSGAARTGPPSSRLYQRQINAAVMVESSSRPAVDGRAEATGRERLKTAPLASKLRAKGSPLSIFSTLSTPQREPGVCAPTPLQFDRASGVELRTERCTTLSTDPAGTANLPLLAQATPVSVQPQPMSEVSRLAPVAEILYLLVSPDGHSRETPRPS